MSRSSRRATRTAPLVLALLCLLPLSAAAEDGVVNFEGWFDGAKGYMKAFEIQQRENRPMFVYFYTDWCGYCRQFERELLSDQIVEDFVGEILAVRINPEAGASERRISAQYGVRGFPTLVMHSDSSPTVSFVDRMKVVDGKPVLMGAEAFVSVLVQAAHR